jgi:hypothetical protein
MEGWLMRKVAAVVVALGVGVSSSTSAHAATLLVHMLGPSTAIGNLCDVDAREGTNIDFTALPAAVPPTFPVGEGCAAFVCFEIPLVNPKSGSSLGTGVECIRFEDGTTPSPTASSRVTAVTFFVFRTGTLVNATKTTIEPFADGFGNGGNPPRTHLVGSIPDPDAETIIAGTGRFRRSTGRARVSGAVQIAESVFFDCLWKIERDPKRGAD